MLNRKDFCKKYQLSLNQLGELYARRLIPEPIKLGSEYYWRETDIRRWDAYLKKRAKARARGVDPNGPAGPGVPTYSHGIQSADVRNLVAQEQERERRAKSKTLAKSSTPVKTAGPMPKLPEPRGTAVEK